MYSTFRSQSRLSESCRPSILRFKDARIMLSLYKTLVRCHVECCVSPWRPYYRKVKELLEKAQRRFTKMIVNVDRLSYEDRLQSLKLWSLEERRNRQDLIEVFKMSKGMTITRLTSRKLPPGRP